MKEFNIEPLDLDKDIPTIDNWEKEFADTLGMKNIKHFILEDNIYYSLAEVIETNYEKFQINKNEKKYAYVFKNQDGEILGFTLNVIIEAMTPEPELIIQYIVINPKYQGQGIAKKALTTLMNNPQEYYGSEFKSAFSRIDRLNVMSRKLFESLGFNLNYTNTNYLSATKSEITHEKE